MIEKIITFISKFKKYFSNSRKDRNIQRENRKFSEGNEQLYKLFTAIDPPVVFPEKRSVIGYRFKVILKKDLDKGLDIFSEEYSYKELYSEIGLHNPGEYDQFLKEMVNKGILERFEKKTKKDSVEIKKTYIKIVDSELN